MNTSSKLKLTTAISAATFLTACLPDDSDSQELTGRVADGYLVNAKICIDENLNGLCDGGEPTTFSTAGGHYTFNDLEEKHLELPLIAEVTAGQTVDEDNPTQAIENDFRLTSQAAAEFISPITTIVQHRINKGESLEMVIDSLQSLLGANFDPYTDFVAESKAGMPDADMYEQAHAMAQVAAKAFGSTLAHLKEQPEFANLSDQELAAFVDAKITDNFIEIHGIVEQHLAAIKDAEANNLPTDEIDTLTDLAEQLAGEITTIENEDLLGQIELENKDSTNSVDLIEALTAGLQSFDADSHYIDKQTHILINSELHETFMSYELRTEQWYDYSDDRSQNYHLDTNGDLVVSNLHPVVTDNGDNSFNFDYGHFDFDTTVTAVDLSGTPIKSYLLSEDDTKAMAAESGDAVFPDPSFEYRVQFIPGSQWSYQTFENCQIDSECYSHVIAVQDGSPFNAVDISDLVMPLDVSEENKVFVILTYAHFGEYPKYLTAYLFEDGSVEYGHIRASEAINSVGNTPDPLGAGTFVRHPSGNAIYFNASKEFEDATDYDQFTDATKAAIIDSGDQLQGAIYMNPSLLVKGKARVATFLNNVAGDAIMDNLFPEPQIEEEPNLEGIEEINPEI